MIIPKLVEKYVHFWKESVVPLEYFMKYLNEEKVMEAKEYKRVCESNILEIISEGQHFVSLSGFYLFIQHPTCVSVSNFFVFMQYPILVSLSDFYLKFSSNIHHSALSFHHHSLYDLYLNNCFTHSTY